MLEKYHSNRQNLCKDKVGRTERKMMHLQCSIQTSQQNPKARNERDSFWLRDQCKRTQASKHSLEWNKGSWKFVMAFGSGIPAEKVIHAILNMVISTHSPSSTNIFNKVSACAEIWHPKCSGISCSNVKLSKNEIFKGEKAKNKENALLSKRIEYVYHMQRNTHTQKD